MTRKKPKNPAKKTGEIPDQETEYRKQLSRLVMYPELIAGLTIQSLHKSVAYMDEGSEVGTLDYAALIKEMAEHKKKLQSGNLAQVEAMLLSHAQILDSAFNIYLAKMSQAKYSEQVEAFGRIAFKAQSQCRQTLSVLGELKHPKRTTFIRQQNNAVNQQINQGESDAKSSEKSSGSENELLEQKKHERLDFRASQTAGRADPEMAAVGEIDGPENEAG